MGKRVALAALLALPLLMVLTNANAEEPAAHAVPSGLPTSLWSIQGTVFNQHHAPVANATVTDGATSVYTDENGHYQLDEPVGAVSLQVTASKVDHSTSSKTVTILDAQEPVDFTLIDYSSDSTGR